MDEYLTVKHISKLYPGVVALDDVSISFKKGEVHALMGANGAGKSTLMKMLSGAEIPSSGEIVFQGKHYEKFSPAEAMEMGIGTVYQEHNLVDTLPVIENIFLGCWPGKHGMVSRREMRRKAVTLLEEFGIQIQLDIPAGNLSPAHQQIIEIMKAVSRQLKVLILDEPTAPLTVSEVEILFDIIRKVKEKGITVLYISHRIEEIFQICDRVSVLQDGRYVVTCEVGGLNRNKLIELMIGKSLSKDNSRPLKELNGEPVLEVEGLCGNGVFDVSFTLHKGEILGFAGLVGSGRTEMMSVIFGEERMTAGTIRVNGLVTKIHSCRDAIKKGIGLIPEDRKNAGLLLENSVRTNITLACLPNISKAMVVDRGREAEIVSQYSDYLQIKTPTGEQQVKRLSGGNQQKVVLAKWLATDVDILIFDEPTRGIDVAAKQEIYKLMRELVAGGKSIMMVSSDMEELLSVSNRIVVISEGHLAGILNRDEFDSHRILDLASGKR